LGVTLLSLGELLAVSDVVSVHTPLTPETTGIVGAPQLARMQPHAILVNTARGKCVDARAVAEALKAGKIGARDWMFSPTSPPHRMTPSFNYGGRTIRRSIDPHPP